MSDKTHGPVSIGYAVSADTAGYSSKRTGGGDFGGRLVGAIAFPAGATVRTISVPIWPRANPGAQKSFAVTLSGLTGAGVTVLRDAANATILPG